MTNPIHGKRHRKLVQVRAEDTRARILQKAREHFAEYGFAGANVRDIAADAGTTHSMIRYHFGTKDQLWREAVRDMFALLLKSLPQPDASLSPRERLARSIKSYARYCAEHPEHARITFAETIRGGERLQWMVDEFVKEDHSIVMPWLEEVMEAGIVPKVPILSFLYAYVGMMQLPFVLANEAKLAANYDFLSEEAIESHAEAVIALLMGPRATPPE